MEFGPFDELTKDFTPERWARIEAMVAEMEEEDRRRAGGSGSLGSQPQDGSSADEQPGRHAPEGR
jgi:hypothetical protein